MVPVIRAENLSKCYRINHADPGRRERTLLGDLARLAGRPLRRLWGGAADRVEDFWALRGVSFEVERGEVLGIIGKNGAGKSTLLKILSQITRPTAGRVRVRGRLSSLLEVGTGFHPELTGRENVYLNGSILGMSRREIGRKFDQIVAFAEVEQFLDTPVKRYSSGMYVRLAFAVAAHLEPDILIIDEVLAVGDLAFQKKCLGMMGDLGRDGRTVLVVSHSMSTVVTLCGRALLLSAGRVVAEGRPTDVVERYLSQAGPVGGELSWPDPAKAPGGDVVRLQAVRVFPEDSPVPRADIDIAKDVLVEITYRVLQDGVRLCPGVWLRDSYGSVVLSTNNGKGCCLQEDPWNSRPYPAGTYRSVCRIPKFFLNDKAYQIAAFVSSPEGSFHAFVEEGLGFTVHDSGDMRGDFSGEWIGVVRPKLEWQTQRCAPADLRSEDGVEDGRVKEDAKVTT